MTMNAMKQALHLTRAGRLDEAVRVIQAKLAGARPGPARPLTGDVIDLTPTLRKVASYLPATPPLTPAPEPEPARHGRFLECRHTGAAGTLEYRLYLPSDTRPGMPLVVMLHGCTQSPEDFARGTGMNRLAEQGGFIVAYPRQSQAANAQKCWNWFRSPETLDGGGELALLAGIITEVIHDHRADPARVFVAGLSAGGAAAANMAARYPEMIAAMAIHSGLAYGAARNLPAALSAMRQGSRNSPDMAAKFVRTITFHGDRDATVNPVNSDQIIAGAVLAHGAPLAKTVEEGRKPGGRGYKREISQDATGRSVIEQWTIAGADHAWSGGDSSGTYTDPAGPDASEEMLRFFLQQ